MTGPQEQTRLPVAARAPPEPDPSVTGLALVDRLLGRLERVVHYHPEPGADATPLLLESLRAALSRGERAVYLAARPVAQVRDDFSRLGHPVAWFDERVHFLEVQDPDPRGLAPLTTPVLEASQGVGLWVETLPAGWGDALAGLVRPLGDRRAFLVAREALETPATTLGVAPRTPAGTPHTNLRLPDGRWIPYQVERPGGARPHVAKVVVVGAHNAGKSSFVHTLSPQGVSIERLGTTVALDHGRLEHRGLTIDVFGTPGQERFDPLIQQAGQGALGVVVLVDSTRPETLRRAQSLAEMVSGGRVPIVWGANKQDVPGALAPDEIAKRLGTDPAFVVGCTATQPTKALPVLDRLLERVLGFALPSS